MRSNIAIAFVIVVTAVVAGTTAATAQPSLTRPTAVPTCGIGTKTPCKRLSRERDLDAPWTLMIAIGGGAGLPTAADAEVGVRLEKLYLYGAALWHPAMEHDRPSLFRVGVDGVFGKKSRGFVGAGVLFTHRWERYDDSVKGFYVRIGANAPITKHVGLRLWGGLGGAVYDDTCDPTWCDGGSGMAVPLIEVHLALAYRL
jgi:hypothetical protein